MAGQQQSQSSGTHTIKQEYICLQNLIYLPQHQICRTHNWGDTWNRSGDPDLHGNAVCWETLYEDGKLVHHLNGVFVSAEPWPQPLMLPRKSNLQHQYITTVAILPLYLMSWVSISGKQSAHISHFLQSTGCTHTHTYTYKHTYINHTLHKAKTRYCQRNGNRYS